MEKKTRSTYKKYSVSSQQIASDREQRHPEKGIKPPFQTAGLIESVATLAVEANSFSLDIVKLTLLSIQVAVTPQHDIVTGYPYNTVKNEIPLPHFSQNRCPDLGKTSFHEQRLVPAVFQKGAHAIAVQRQSDRMPLIKQFHDCRYQLGIGKKFFLNVPLVILHKKIFEKYQTLFAMAA